jgi:multidrug efflux pump subunit AcrB
VRDHDDPVHHRDAEQRDEADRRRDAERGRGQRLSVTVPLAVGLIAILLFMNFNSIVDTLLALSVIPMAVAGGIPPGRPACC